MTPDSTHLPSSLDAPQYILISHTSLSNSSGTTEHNYSHPTLSHPVIEYVYADDGPEAALPRFPGEQVLLLNSSDTADAMDVSAQSLVPGIAVLGVKTSLAPGTNLVDPNAPIGDSRMYVIETVNVGGERTVNADSTNGEADTQAHSILARYRQRNNIIRSVLENSAPVAVHDAMSPTSPDAGAPPTPFTTQQQSKVSSPRA